MNAQPAAQPSMMNPAGVEAHALHEVGVVLLVGGTVVFAVVMLLLAHSLLRRRPAAVAVGRWVIGGGVAFPVAVLSALLLYSVWRTAGLERPPAQPGVVVSVTGRLWWWEVRYRGPAGGAAVVTANELVLPQGQPAQLALASEDVIHSFWVPELGGKRDLVPGRVNRLVVTPLRTGVYRGQCAEYCGLQHARMALHVVVVSPQAFEQWLVQQAGSPPAQAQAPPAADAPPSLVERGRQAFAQQGCAACHDVRGTYEGSMRRGPDLTRVAGRHSLGAGVLPNGPGAFKRWLVGVQQLKPGARMPSYAHLDAATLDALAAYLEQLR
jgi:cytochrome c oxidase subunit 2